MISKLLSVISTAKGAAAATVIAAGAVGTGVVATNSDVQNAVSSAVQTVSGQNVAKPPAAESGQPAVVTARNDADKKLREAFQDDHQKLEKLRSTKVESADRSKLEDLVKTADDKLRARLTRALDDVAALTLGREGRESDRPKPTGSAKPSEGAQATASPEARASFSPDAAAKVDAIVKAAIADMDAITATAEKAVAALPTGGPGKAGEPARASDAGKPSEPAKGKEPPKASPTR